MTDVFDEKRARTDLSNYRKRGPSKSTARLLAALREADGPIESLLDVGGGIGAIAHEMLASGVSRATIVDGSPAYLAAAREESERRATGERLQIRSGDLVEVAADVSCADVVTLDKVVCCYPDMESLLTVSAVRANRLYGLVYPRDSWWVRLGVTLENRLRRLRGSAFRNFVHSSQSIDAALQRAGLTLQFQLRGGWWVIALYERQSA